MIHLSIFILALILPDICFCETTTAQLQGADKKTVLDILGQPTRSSSIPGTRIANSINNYESYSSETLYYGDSQISLINNKVSSIFDLGDIKNLLQRNISSYEESSNWIKWPTPWSPPEAILSELVTLQNEIISEQNK